MSRPAASSAFYVMGRNVTMQRKAWIWVSKWHSRMYRLFCQTGFAASCLLPSLSAKGAALHAPMTLIMMQNMAFQGAKGGMSRPERRLFTMREAAFRVLKHGLSHRRHAFFTQRRWVFCAQIARLRHNSKGYRALRLHTFPCIF